MICSRFGSAVVLLTVLACSRREASPAPPAASITSLSPAPSAASAAASPPQVANVTPPPKLETVSANTEPYCRKNAGLGSMATNHPWLSDAIIQQKLTVLDEELKPYSASLIGITFENEPKNAVVVLYPHFSDYQGLQARLAPKVKPLQVVLRPGCHSAEQLAEAQGVLQARAWHPNAKTTPMGWHLDAASSAYAVVIEDSAPEVAEALRQALGDRVQVTLGKPRRLALGADAGLR